MIEPKSTTHILSHMPLNYTFRQVKMWITYNSFLFYIGTGIFAPLHNPKQSSFHV